MAHANFITPLPNEVESDTLIFGYWPLPGKSRVATDRVRKLSHAKDSFQRPLALCHDVSGQAVNVASSVTWHQCAAPAKKCRRAESRPAGKVAEHV